MVPAALATKRRTWKARGSELAHCHRLSTTRNGVEGRQPNDRRKAGAAVADDRDRPNRTRTAATISVVGSPTSQCVVRSLWSDGNQSGRRQQPFADGRAVHRDGSVCPFVGRCEAAVGTASASVCFDSEVVRRTPWTTGCSQHCKGSFVRLQPAFLIAARGCNASPVGCNVANNVATRPLFRRCCGTSNCVRTCCGFRRRREGFNKGCSGPGGRSGRSGAQTRTEVALDGQVLWRWAAWLWASASRPSIESRQRREEARRSTMRATTTPRSCWSSWPRLCWWP